MANWELPVSLLVFGSVGLLAYIAVNYKVKLFTMKESEGSYSNVKAVDSPTLMQVMLQLLCIWTVPLLLQMASEIASVDGASANIATLLETAYTVSIFIGITVTTYTVIAALMALLIWLGVDIANTKLGGGNKDG